MTKAGVDASGLDHLLVWAARLGSSRVHFQTGRPVWVRVSDRNHRATEGTLDEGVLASIVEHLCGSNGLARLRHGGDLNANYWILTDGSTPLLFRFNATSTYAGPGFGANVVLCPVTSDLPLFSSERQPAPTARDAR